MKNTVLELAEAVIHDAHAAIRTLNVQSVPVNILTPIAGTPFQDVPSLSAEDIAMLKRLRLY